MRIGTTQLPRRVQQHIQDKYGITVEAPHYRRCFDYAVANRYPAEFSGNRWTTEDTPDNLDKVAVALGLIGAEVVARGQRQRPASTRGTRAPATVAA